MKYALLAPLALLFACTEPLELPEGCQPHLAGADCFLPYPSDFFLAQTEDGPRVVHTGAGKLKTVEGLSADVTDWKPSDGFSRHALIMALLGSPMTTDGLVSVHDDYARSQSTDSATLLVEADTGRLIGHFADIDPRPEDPARRSITLRPQEQLSPETRYIAVLQGVRGPGGELADAPEGFRRLRDRVKDPGLDALAARYEADLFPVLDELGLDRGALQLAWDFTTHSDALVLEDMLRVRDLVLAELDVNPPTVIIDAVLENERDEIFRTVIGRVVGPLVMDHAYTDAALFRGADGQVALNGTAEIGFTVTVPASIAAGTEPGLALEYGHGFFGLRDEITYGKERALFNNIGAVAFSVDWWGMMEDDIGTVLADLGFDVFDAVSFTDRLHQSMANWLTLTAAIPGALADEPSLQRADGALFYDPSAVHYMGISQGHILGGVHVALNPDIQRAILHVGGSQWMHMAMRAEPFSRYLDALRTAMPDDLDQLKAMASFQMHFDRVDPATWAPFVVGQELPTGPSGAAERQVLMQVALGDAQVPNFSTYFHARTMGLPVLTPSPADIFSLEETTGPARSALAVYDVGVDLSVYDLPVPPEDDNPAHKDLRKQQEVQLQIETFLREGEIVHPCEGPCVLTLE
jgi:hypothetical protein